jgi:hypothetical protein
VCKVRQPGLNFVHPERMSCKSAKMKRLMELFSVQYFDIQGNKHLSDADTIRPSHSCIIKRELRPIFP